VLDIGEDALVGGSDNGMMRLVDENGEDSGLVGCQQVSCRLWGQGLDGSDHDWRVQDAAALHE
jgi:hypothetical protein